MRLLHFLLHLGLHSLYFLILLLLVHPSVICEGRTLHERARQGLGNVFLLEGATLFLVIASEIVSAAGYLQKKTQNLIFLANDLVLLELLVKGLESLCLLVEQKLVMGPRIGISHDLIFVFLFGLCANFLQNELFDLI